MLREYLEGSLRQDIRDLRRDLGAQGERIAALEAVRSLTEHQELTDTQRLRLTAQGPIAMPGWGPPGPPGTVPIPVGSVPPKRRRGSSDFPKALLTHLTDPRVLVILTAFLTWLASHFGLK